MNRTTKTVTTRRYDLDALRACAMLLGIVFHAIALVSIVRVSNGDASPPNQWITLLGQAIHGFRMQLFFLMSGFFSAMLWERRGMKALLKHRFLHVLLPFALGMLTLQPLTVKVMDTASLAEKQTIPRTHAAMGAGSNDHTLAANGVEKSLPPASVLPPLKSWLGHLLSAGLYVPSTGSLWFLWYLWWLIIGFAVVTLATTRLPYDTFFKQIFARHCLLSRTRYVWLVPLTMLLQAYMGFKGAVPSLGPDTFQGFIPMPHVLAYYALFFGVGIWYFRCDDTEGNVGRLWWCKLPLALLVIFPLASEFTLGTFGFRDHLPNVFLIRSLSLLLQSLYTWIMVFSLMGMFRTTASRESLTMRYLSDAAYWLYLAHLPLLVAVEVVVWRWSLPCSVKLLLTCVIVSGILLVTYEKLVRYTWVGALLNGRRERTNPYPVQAT